MALEGALKLKEISYIHAEGYPAAEMKHGPIALVDEDTPSVFLVPRGAVYDKVMSNLEEIKARGGPVIAVACEDDEHVAAKADDVIYVPSVPEYLQPLVVGDAAAVAGVPHRPAARLRHRQAAEPGQERDGGVSSFVRGSDPCASVSSRTAASCCLEPLTLTRPAFDLLCGADAAATTSAAISRPTRSACSVRPRTRRLCRCHCTPTWPSTTPPGSARHATILVNARWLPPADRLIDLRRRASAWSATQVAYVVLPARRDRVARRRSMIGCNGCSRRLPRRAGGGTMLDYLWDLVDHNAEALCAGLGGSAPCGRATHAAAVRCAVTGPAGQVVVAEDGDDRAVRRRRHARRARSSSTAGPWSTRSAGWKGRATSAPETWILGAKVRGGTTRPELPRRRRGRGQHRAGLQQQVPRRLPRPHLRRRMGQPRRRHADERPAQRLRRGHA